MIRKYRNFKSNEFPKNCDDFGFLHFRDGVTIFIGDYRQDDFFNLLQKIVDGDFDQITTGEVWTAEDLLKGYQENIDTLLER